MADFRKENNYFYCPDYDRYVRCHNGVFYNIKNGKEEFNSFYSKILFGDIYYEDISKEEYYAQIY